MLYVYVIQNREAPPETYVNYLSAAARCQDYLESVAEKGSLSERYCLVLEELRHEALRHTTRMPPVMVGLESHRDLHGPEVPTSSLTTSATDRADTDYTRHVSDNEAMNSMPEAASCDFPDWEEFFSLVSSGLGIPEVSTNNE